MFQISIIIGKAIIAGMRLFGRSGSALPGLIVERLYSGFLARSLKQLPQGVVLVTGTNGKTTTTKVLSELLTAQGLRVLTNPTGSNFVRGTISVILRAIRLNGHLDYDIAVFEQDEAYAVQFARLVRPRGTVALNVMRDQMDRFGEIDTTAKLIGQVLASTTEWVVVNANDPRIAQQVTKDMPARPYWFGHRKRLQQTFLTDDQHHHQDDLTFYEAARPLVCLEAIRPGKVTLDIKGRETILATPLNGTHNAINLAAAVTALAVIKPDYDDIKLQSAVRAVRPAFGRGEQIVLPNGVTLQLQLVKNPGGFTHALRQIGEAHYDQVAIAINDDYADGRDVSWLWDVEFIALQDRPVICGGTRGYDMAVRLKYDGVTDTDVHGKLPDFFNAATGGTPGSTAIIFCTYTAMLRLRVLLRQAGAKIEEVGL